MTHNWFTDTVSSCRFIHIAPGCMIIHIMSKISGCAIIHNVFDIYGTLLLDNGNDRTYENRDCLISKCSYWYIINGNLSNWKLLYYIFIIYKFCHILRIFIISSWHSSAQLLFVDNTCHWNIHTSNISVSSLLVRHIFCNPTVAVDHLLVL